MVSSCLNAQLFFLSPKGASPPLVIEILGSGMIFLRLGVNSTPRPLQVGHIPFGELNEKVLGSGTA